MTQAKIVLCLIVCILSFSMIFAVGNNNDNGNDDTQNNTQENNMLYAGKNNVTTSEAFRPIYVQDFMRQYPDIEVISYKDGEDTKGFVNVFGGIGENFIMRENRQYEFIVTQNITMENL